MRTRNSMLLAAAACVIAAALPAVSAQAETVVRYGISMADIPLTTGQPDRGAGAYQFTAYTIYDPLVAWEMDVSDRPGKLVPGLATEWKVDEADKTKWRFTLAQGRQISRRQRLQRRCGDLESRQGAERQGAAIRQAPERAGEDPPALGRELRQDRRLHRRDHHQDRRLVLPLSDAVVPGFQPRAIRKARQGLGQIRQPAVGHRPVQADQAGAARTGRTDQERRLLGQEADSESRQADPDPDAGSADAHQRAAGRPGRPDRDAGARRGAAAQIGRHADRRQRHPACLELSPQRAAGLALDRHPAAQGAQSRDRPRRRGRPDERPRQTRQGPGRSVEPVVRQADASNQIRSRRRPRSWSRKPAIRRKSR